jgi:hypothetical protein
MGSGYYPPGYRFRATNQYLLGTDRVTYEFNDIGMTEFREEFQFTDIHYYISRTLSWDGETYSR